MNVDEVNGVGINELGSIAELLALAPKSMAGHASRRSSSSGASSAEKAGSSSAGTYTSPPGARLFHSATGAMVDEPVGTPSVIVSFAAALNQYETLAKMQPGPPPVLQGT